METDRWELSGHYEFTIPDYYCLKNNDHGKNGKAKHSGRTETRDIEKICPKIKGDLIADAVMADTPIINLDIGAKFVIHFLDGPKWNGTKEFRLSSASGDTTQVSAPVWQVQGRMVDPKTLVFTLIGPKGQRGDEITATKVEDFYADIHVRPRTRTIIPVGLDALTRSEQPK